MEFWSVVREELREAIWLVSIIGSLSILGVGLAVGLAVALDVGAFNALAHV